MDHLEQENRYLREEVVSLKADMANFTALVEQLVAAQNQPLPPPPPPHSFQATIIYEIQDIPVTAVPVVSAAQYRMPQGYLWGMPKNFVPDGYTLAAQVVYLAQPVAVSTPPVMNATPVFNRDPEIPFPPPPSESVDFYDRVDGFQEQFDKMQKELKALKGKELFGDNVNDLCLVPNVKVPAKFKIPEFKKYKGNSCPRDHLLMYLRKMSTHTDDQRLLIHFFQDKHYDYNMYMAPDRDQLRAMTQKDKESFKEYAQRWCELAAQVVPPLSEQELTKVFQKTLGPFYYGKMVVSAPNNFVEMPSFGFTKKKEEVNALGRSRNPSKRYSRPQQVAAITLVVATALTTIPYNKVDHQGQAPRREPFDPIPMTYTELYPALVKKHPVQPRAPPAVPNPLPWYYKADHTCVYHQEAPGHNLENCFPLKSEVQKMVKSGLLSFKDMSPNVQGNPLPNHGNAVNMIDGEVRIYDVNLVNGNLVRMHAALCKVEYFSHDHNGCDVCSIDIRGCELIKNDL
ncbi:uncharacterized protein LOC131598545 [Vicia villosa]|uniref:uncharacterized protein LOC131598545 n=1 Tax=Vicia villosa TaxID=3911 RepID=UPI00273C13BD|nr:uncharacterized protein LOC131598545 [Vicia villosa]